MNFLKRVYNIFKDTFKQIKLPSKKESVVLLIFLVVYAVLSAFMICGDCFYGYAITEKICHPSFFSARDLVVNGAAGNFLFYKILSILPLFSDNYNLRDFVLSTPITILLFLGWYNVFSEITSNKKVVFLSMFFLLFSDAKLYLHGYPIPFFLLTSLGSVHFIQIFALFFFLKKRYTTSFILLSLSTYFHPASGLVFLLILGLILFIEAIKTKDFKVLYKPFLFSALLVLPNIIFLGGNINVSSAEKALFFKEMIQLKQAASSYIDFYWTRSYFITFATLFLVLFSYRKNNFFMNHQKTVVSFVVIGFVGSILSLINTYFIKNLNFFYVLFIARAFYIVKPLLMLYIVFVFDDLFSRRNIFAKALSLLLLVSLVTLSSFWGGIIVLSSVAYYLVEPKIKYLSEKQTSNEEKRNIKILIAILIFAAIFYGYARNNKFYKIYQLMRGRNVFNFSFNVDQNYSISKTNPKFSDLMNFTKQYHGKLFAVPLDGRNDFVYFRYLAKNSIYANIDDMGQLSYSPKDFLEGYNRMVDLGFKVDPGGVLNFSGYNNVSFDHLKSLGIDFAIFDKLSTGYVKRTQAPVFENDKYIVYKIAD